MDMQDYDARIGVLVPNYRQCVAAVAGSVGDVATLTSLGIGTGNIEALILRSRPHVGVLGIDLDQTALTIAQGKLAEYNVQLVQGDLRNTDWGRPDAIVSGLAIHHLEHDEQRALFRRIHDRLPPGGVFTNFEVVLGETATETLANERYLVDHWRRQGLSDAQIHNGLLEMAAADKPMALSQHRDALEQAGFTVEILHHDHQFCVYTATK